MQPTFLRDEPAERLDLDDFLPHRLSMSSRAVSALVSRAYRDRCGLTAAQWSALSRLAEHGELRGALPGAAKATADLVRLGLAYAEGARLTPAGEQLYAEIAPRARAYEATLIASLAPEEVRMLKRLLLRLEGAAAALAGDAEPTTWAEP